MGQRGFPRMTALSAAALVTEWIALHGGLRPVTRDCRNTNGLPHHTAIYRLFGSAGSFGLMIAQAEACVSQYQEALVQPGPMSAVYSNSGMKMRTCLGRSARGQDCEVRFPDEGAHIRFCNKCRTKGHNRHSYAPQEDALTIDVGVTRVELKRWGLQASGGYEEEIDWGGSR